MAEHLPGGTWFLVLQGYNRDAPDELTALRDGLLKIPLTADNPAEAEVEALEIYAGKRRDRFTAPNGLIYPRSGRLVYVVELDPPEPAKAPRALFPGPVFRVKICRDPVQEIAARLVYSQYLNTIPLAQYPDDRVPAEEWVYLQGIYFPEERNARYVENFLNDYAAAPATLREMLSLVEQYPDEAWQEKRWLIALGTYVGSAEIRNRHYPGLSHATKQFWDTNENSEFHVGSGFLVRLL